MVAHTYNSSSAGGRDQEDQGLRQSGQKVSKNSSQPIIHG
jgi:hypothetical protein